MKVKVFDKLKINDIFSFDNGSLFIKSGEYEAKGLLSPKWIITPRLLEEVYKIEEIKDFSSIYNIFTRIEKNKDNIKVSLKNNSFEAEAVIFYNNNGKPYLFNVANTYVIEKNEKAIVEELSKIPNAFVITI